MPHNDTPLSIGRLSKEVGILPTTLRAWERRYGFPTPLRLESGHRRYPQELLPRLRLVAEGVAAGHRPSALLRASFEHLNAIVGASVPCEPASSPSDWHKHVESYDDRWLRRWLLKASEGRTSLEFLDGYVSPLLAGIGRAWANGTLAVGHEHFASEVVEDCLRAIRGAAVTRPHRSRGEMLLTTLPGERHALGLHMAALICSDNRWTPQVIGVETPVGEIARTARHTETDAVGISVSLASDHASARTSVLDLRARLPKDCALTVGGRGARRLQRMPRDVQVLPELHDLQRWLTDGR